MSEKLAAAVHAMTGTTNDDEALGRLAAYKANSDRVPALEKSLADLGAKATASERDQLVAQGVRDSKVTPAQRDAFASGKGFLATLSTDLLLLDRCFIELRKVEPRAKATIAAEVQRLLAGAAGT